METIEIFDETYYGAHDEAEFHKIMEEIGWKFNRDYGKIDIPKAFPCIFRISVGVSGNSGAEYPNVYSYPEGEIKSALDALQSLF